MRCLIILNVAGECGLLLDVWEEADLVVAADGGANRLFRSVSPLEDKKEYIPNAIVGDLDSVDPAVIKYFASRGCKIHKSDCQVTNDLEKCLMFAKEAGAEEVVIFGQFGGRLDQEMANLNALLVWTGSFKTLVLLSPRCEARVIPKGSWKLDYSHLTDRISRKCGLLPLVPAEEVSSSGLKWELHSQKLEFGMLISTSNWLCGDSVEIKCSDPIVWTMAFHAKRGLPPLSSLAAVLTPHTDD